MKRQTGEPSTYTAIEDKLICTAWKKIGVDPTVGTEQSKHS
jgi:hypothetical protein